jgi:hypothetical protein
MNRTSDQIDRMTRLMDAIPSKSYTLNLFIGPKTMEFCLKNFVEKISQVYSLQDHTVIVPRASLNF